MNNNEKIKILFVAKHNESKKIFNNLNDSLSNTNYKIDLDYLPNNFLIKLFGTETKNKFIKLFVSLLFQFNLRKTIQDYSHIVICPGGFVSDVYLGLGLHQNKKVFILESGFMYEFKNELNLNKKKFINNLIKYRKSLFKQNNEIIYLVQGSFYKNILIDSNISADKIVVVGSPRTVEKDSNYLESNKYKLIYLCSSHSYENLKEEGEIEKNHLNYLNTVNINNLDILVKPHPRGLDIEYLQNMYKNINFHIFDMKDINNFGNIIFSNQSTGNFEAIYQGIPAYFLDSRDKFFYIEENLKVDNIEQLPDLVPKIITNYFSIVQNQKKIVKKYIEYSGKESLEKIISSFNI